MRKFSLLLLSLSVNVFLGAIRLAAFFLDDKGMKKEPDPRFIRRGIGITGFSGFSGFEYSDE